MAFSLAVRCCSGAWVAPEALVDLETSSAALAELAASAAAPSVALGLAGLG